MAAEERNRRLAVYMETISPELPPYLLELEKEAALQGVPIVRRDALRALILLLAMKKPDSILEIGTAVGYSALCFLEYSDARVVTIENDPERIRQAKQNILNAGKSGRVTLLEGNAEEILPAIRESFPCIFLDAAQGQYVHFLPQIIRLLSPGGVLLTDNVLIGGDLIESRYAIERRNRTIHKRMREYLRSITEREGLVTTVFPVGDGLLVTVKK